MFEQFEYVNLLAGAGKFQVKGGLFARDINGNRLGLHVYHGNDKAALSGTVQGIAKFPPNSDNIEKFEFTGEIGQNGSDVWVDLPKECYYYSGPMTVAIRLVDGDSRTVLATFSGHVNDITDGTPTVPPQSLPDNLEDFIAELEGMRTTVETAAAKVDSMEEDVDDLKSALNVSRTRNLFDPINKSGTVDGITYTFDNGKFGMNGTKTGWVVIQTISGSVGDKFSLSSMARSAKPSIYIRDGSTNVATFASADGYVTFTLPSESVNISAYMSGTFDYTFSLCLVKDEIPSFPLLLREDGENTIKNFADCTYEAIGDSLTYGFTGSWDSGQQVRVANPYPDVVKNILGFKTALNKGETGTTIANDLDKKGTYWPISNDNRLNGYSYAQVISVMGGTNDYTLGTQLGTVYDTQNMSTFHAGWKRILSKLVGSYANYDPFVFVIIPPVTQALRTDNSAGYKWVDYINATIDEAQLYGVPVLDMSHGRLCAVNNAVYTHDGIHFNQKYISRIFAPMVADFIKRNCH